MAIASLLWRRLMRGSQQLNLIGLMTKVGKPRRRGAVVPGILAYVERDSDVTLCRRVGYCNIVMKGANCDTRETIYTIHAGTLLHYSCMYVYVYLSTTKHAVQQH